MWLLQLAAVAASPCALAPAQDPAPHVLHWNVAVLVRANAYSSPFWHALGIARSRGGNAETAAAAFAVALRLDGDAVEVRHDLGMAQCELGRWREALPNLEAAWQAGRGDAGTMTVIARARLGSGDRDGALAMLEAAGSDADRGLAERLAPRDFDPLRADPRFQRVHQLAETAAKAK
jgi:tetratricopeptide (TPR) repeat protein